MFGLQQQQQQGGAGGGDLGTPEVQIQHSSLFNYWLVTIRCRDRNKLFFDTVCTLCDMRYDIFHATIDGEPSGWAHQLFYIRPRFGECVWDERRASVLQAMLSSAVQRRFPPGLRVHVFSGSNVVLQDLVRGMRRHRLTITRCKVRAYESASHTFSLLNQDGSLPSRQYVQMACQSAGGELVEAPLDLANPCVATVLRSLDARGRFAFSFVNLRTYKPRDLAPAGAASDVPLARHAAREAGVGTAGGSGAAGIGGGADAGYYLRGDQGPFGGPGRAKQGALTMARPAGGVVGGRGGGSGGAASYSSENHPSF
ncbi:hypothetical protein COO60DRAFT_1512839 [Scenedesmus sp. NREL 46B-D3]|nr:hypothetical protein COO60DRAFT_1512839 [Scenedesmus sp. NREL 46B-D3]